MKKLTFLVIVLCLSGVTLGQDAIEDNSFLIEEAYNQEKGVVQYISTFLRERGGKWAYSFTNEIPMNGQRHQFSYTINFADTGNGKRFGDTLLNYRIQLAGMNGEGKVAVAPRVSLIVPTGQWRRETGAGSPGFQFNLPVSVKHSKKIVTHWNAGTTVIPGARNAAGDRAGIKGFNLGQSTIFLARSNLNLMFETAWYHNEVVSGDGLTRSEKSLLLNPGIRWAWNFKSGLQIVPGVSFPIGVGPSSGERGAFLYLSFEK